MKTFSFTLLLLGATSFFSNAQVKDASDNLKQQASKMGAAFVSSDYKIFANYTYPLILKSMGGAAKMADVLTKTTNDMKAKGMTFSNITFDEPPVGASLVARDSALAILVPDLKRGLYIYL